MSLVKLERVTSMSHLFINKSDLVKEEKLIIDRITTLLSKSLTHSSLNDLSRTLESVDPEGWVRLNMAFKYLDHDDTYFREFYRQEISESEFLNMDGFDFSEKVFDVFIDKMDKNNDIKFQDDVSDFLDAKRIEYILEHQFPNHGLDVENIVSEYLEQNQMNDYIEFDKPTMNQGFSKL